VADHLGLWARADFSKSLAIRELRTPCRFTLGGIALTGLLKSGKVLRLVGHNAMQTKTIVVLANSVKKSGRCLAGKEVFRSGDGWKTGDWIRPVGTEDGGEISEYKMSLALGHDPALLEFVEIPMAKAVPHLDQPENWLIEAPSKGSWKSHGKMKREHLELLLDKPKKLWHDSNTTARRVRSEFPRKMEKPASLYLLKPDKIESISVWSEPNNYPGAYPVKRRRVLRIQHASVLHELDIDDPIFAKRYYPKFPSVKESAKDIALAKPDETVICVSLTGSFNGYHYKIAAAFFEPES
jgi:hypothetical protein